MNKVQKFLHKPYALSADPRSRVFQSFYFALFVYLFLAVFQPFGLNQVPNNNVLLLGYGLVTFMVMLMLNVIIPPFLSSFFSETKWSVGREIIWSLVNIAGIGLANAFYSSFIGIARLSFEVILIFETYTLLIGVFPVIITVLVRESQLSKKYARGSAAINEELVKLKTTFSGRDQIIKLPNQSGDDLAMQLDQLYYLKAADNYVEVYFDPGRGVQKKLLRNSLKSLSEHLNEVSQLFRCHKSFMVNLDKVSKISGNAQGYKLHLFQQNVEVPVSRQFNEIIKERLSPRP
jgi:hypothetical protein